MASSPPKATSGDDVPTHEIGVELTRAQVDTIRNLIDQYGMPKTCMVERIPVGGHQQHGLVHMRWDPPRARQLFIKPNGKFMRFTSLREADEFRITA